MLLKINEKSNFKYLYMCVNNDAGKFVSGKYRYIT